MKSKNLWGIAEPRNLQRAHREGYGETIRVFKLREEYGLYESNIAAKRAYLEAMEPDLFGCSDDFIRLHWRYCVNMQTAKIIKVKGQDK